MSFKSEVEAAAAHNSTNHDARHYIWNVLASCRSHYISQKERGTDVIAVDVSCNAR